jgi:hypothetical protein
VYDISDEIFKSIHLIVDRKLQELRLDRTVQVTIISKIEDNKYRVFFQGVEYDAYSMSSEEFAPQETVFMFIPENNFSNKKFILGIVAKIPQDLTANLVTINFQDVGTNVAAQDLVTNRVSQVTISADTTLTTTVPIAGSTSIVIIVTSGSTSRTVTFGTGFKSTGTLATGATANRRFVLSFVSDGTNLIEISRTTAITY